MRFPIIAFALLVGTTPLAAQGGAAPADSAPPVRAGCNDRNQDGRCDDEAQRGRDCARDETGSCAEPHPVGPVCVDRDGDRRCDAARGSRVGSFFRALGSAVASLWRETVPEENGGGNAPPADPSRPRAP